MLDELIDTLIYERYPVSITEIENMEYTRFQTLIANIASNVKQSRTDSGDGKMDLLKYINNVNG